MTVLMSRGVSNFPVQEQLFRLLSFTYVESHRDYLTVESTDVVSCKAFSDVRLRRTFVLRFRINYFQRISSYAAFSAEHVRSMTIRTVQLYLYGAVFNRERS